MRRGIFLCSADHGNPLTLPEAVSSSDLTGVEISPGVHWQCVAVPLDQMSRYSGRVLRVLEELGVDIL